MLITSDLVKLLPEDKCPASFERFDHVGVGGAQR